MGERLEVAKEVLERAKEEYKRGKALKENLFIRNACDKAFLAVVQAVNDLVKEKTGVVPTDHRMRRDFLREMGREDLRAEYSDIMRDLHDDCFYSGIIIEKNIEKAVQKVEEFLKKIEEAEKS